jgi:hypothetical protein
MKKKIKKPRTNVQDLFEKAIVCQQCTAVVTGDDIAVIYNNTECLCLNCFNQVIQSPSRKEKEFRSLNCCYDVVFTFNDGSTFDYTILIDDLVEAMIHTAGQAKAYTKAGGLGITQVSLKISHKDVA